MKNFDSLTLKYLEFENHAFIQGSIVQKIQLINRYEIILMLRNIALSKNRKLYININPKYPHICFIDENSIKKRNIVIPKNPPMFCMQLRKYLSGSKIKDIKVVDYERIMELYFDCFDEVGSLKTICLAIELMGKHSNVILYNDNDKKILGSIHNISCEKSSIRQIYGGIKYSYPPQKPKLDILKTSFASFCQIAKENDAKNISENFYYLCKDLADKILKKCNDLKNIFEFTQNLILLKEKDFMVKYWDEYSMTGKDLNFAIDNYFSNVMFFEILSQKKEFLKKYLNRDINKLLKIIQREPENKALEYKTKGDLILANFYKIEKGQNEIILDKIKIEIDGKLSAGENSQIYYAKYKKAQNSYFYALSRYNDAKEKIQYYNSILFNIENCISFEELDEIKDEIIDLGLIKEEKSRKEISKISKIEYRGFEIYLGKNNKQNDFIISKIARSEDLWFHGLNYPSAHVILKIHNDKKQPDKDVLEYCAKMVKENSSAKNSGKTSIIMTKRKNLKKPKNTYLGFVTYKNETEIVI